MLTLKRRFHFPACSLTVEGRRSLVSFWNPAAMARSLTWEIQFFQPTAVGTDPVLIKGNATQIEQLQQAVNQYLTTTLLAQPAPDLPLVAPTAKVFKPQEQPSLHLRGLLSHELRCGSLASPQDQISLSATQLADLTTALDTYAQALAAQTLFARSTPLPWRSLVTGTAIATLMTAAGLFYWQRTRTPVPTLSAAPEVDQRNNLAEEVIPPPPLDAPTPLPTPTLPGDLAQLDRLNPPGGVTVPNRPLPPANSGASQPAPGRSGSGSSSNAAADPASPAESSAETEIATNRPTPNIPPLPALDDETGDAEVAIAPESPRLSPAPAPAPAPAARPAPAPLPPAPARQSSPPTAASAEPEQLETIPQVAQVQQYFAGRSRSGQIPSGGVSYRLTIGPQGELVRFLPLNDRSTDYVDNVAMPHLGEVFVSPLGNRRQAEINVQIQSNGRVSTNLEKLQ